MRSASRLESPSYARKVFETFRETFLAELLTTGAIPDYLNHQIGKAVMEKRLKSL